VYSITLYIQQHWLSEQTALWTDVLWCTLMLFFGSGSGYTFLIFLFAIIATALRHDEGRSQRMTIFCGTILFLSGFHALTFDALANALLPTTFLFGVGYLISQCAEVMVEERRRLTILVDVTRLSNPRFGTDHTLNNIMQLTARFYGASSCILIMREPENRAWTMRTATQAQAPSGRGAQQIDDAIANAMMAYGSGEIVLFTRHGVDECVFSEQYICDAVERSWVRIAPTSGAPISDMLDTDVFISVPVPLRSGAGRMFIVTDTALGQADAEFLSKIVSEAFPVIENIRLLDRLASSAASRERDKIAHDLHDSFLQPYIGLHHALRAISTKVDSDNPLLHDIRKLSAMTSNVIADLRQLAAKIPRRNEFEESAFVIAILGHAERLKQFYGLTIAVHVDGHLGINDRMATEIFQIVCEATSNIRKHTAATRGSVTLTCVKGWLNLKIENECVGDNERGFMPRSICERVAALGGSTCVERLSSGSTAVRVDIPV
jgi:signal transduction histidine kinase